ncbi:MAG: hypothetical protein HYR62_03530 [Actinobacteria bacterium]|nr:hypothetical protein [Actinomycetota bacterium]MBI3686570.1 hypothetical protein [Actinomycetota bacterium]
MHLDQDVLCVHSVALRHGGSRRVVVLLGGHGAGKTLVALGLAERGWRVVSGDVTLVDCHDHGSVPVVVGGTRAVIARRGPVLRWFPDLRLTAADIDTVDLDTVDLSHRPGLLGPDLSAGNVVAVVAVDVDGDPRAGIGKVEVADRHLAASVWLRASGHLLDRVLEGNEMALREFEDVAAARRRVTQVRALADRMPMHAAWGAPRRIAALVEHLSASSAGSGQRRAR